MASQGDRKFSDVLDEELRGRSMSKATQMQPMSRLTAESQDVTSWFAEFIDSPILPALLERRAVGMRKYGIPLTTFNGRDPLIDAYQEALDLVVYLAQRDAECDLLAASELTYAAVALAEQLMRRVGDL